jgi:AbrB family looped-hinge helix DNA binding protein
MAIQPAVLEFLTTTRIGEKGQVTVPKQFRENLGLGLGAPFAVLRLGNGLILMPQQDHFDRLCKRIGSALASTGSAPKAVLAKLPEARERVFEHRYGSRARKPVAAQRTARRASAR